LDDVGGGATEKEKECPKGEMTMVGRYQDPRMYSSRNLERYGREIQDIPVAAGNEIEPSRL